MNATKHVIIVGGGVLGLSTAYYALQRGHRVTLIERGAADHDGCSLGNCGLVTPSHFIPLAAPGMVGMGLRMMWNPESPFYIKPRLDLDFLGWAWKFFRAANPRHVARAAPVLRDLILASRRCFEELADLSGNEFGFAKKGLLMLCKTRHALEEETRTALMARKLGLSAEILTPAETAALDPAVRMDVHGAVYYPQDSHLLPHRFVAWLTREVHLSGAAFAWENEATGWRVRDNRIEALRTSCGDFAGDEFVLAGGSWSPQLVSTLGLRLPMQAGKGYTLTLATPPRLPGLASICVEARVAVTPMGSGLRFGGTMEIAGLDLSINPARIRGITGSAQRYFPEFEPKDFRDAAVWRGLRPLSPDGLPYVGRFTRYANLSAATGHAMLGLMLGPITGRLMAEILSDEKPSIEIGLLRPDRYE